MATLQNPGKKPRLSLKIKTSCGPAVRSTRGFPVDPSDPTAFNTLSNVYVTAIERSTPLTAINTLQSFSISSPVEAKNPKQRIATPYVATYPETPLTAHPASPANLEMIFPSAMTATPPLSAGPATPNSTVFTFSAADTARRPPMPARDLTSPVEARSPRRRRPSAAQINGLGLQLPYTHPRTLHSILRNSPLPPRTALSPRRQSVRLQEKAGKRVEYNNPLTQEIINSKYIKSHIDLLVEEASPNSPSSQLFQPHAAVDLATAFEPNEIQDGGQTPGPFEDMQRRLASLGSASQRSPVAPSGIRKRPRRDKKRRWVWTIGQDAEYEQNNDEVSDSMAAIRAENVGAKRQKETPDEATTPTVEGQQAACLATPTPSIESIGSVDSSSDCFDTDMSDTASSLASEDSMPSIDMELDVKTPTAPKRLGELQLLRRRDSPIPELRQNRRDTPIPPEHGTPKRDTPVPYLSSTE
ncbi:hypothetical protein S40288_08067 [Stachybotrys chartarum IBT 40288]|nr:hypothetical protein S40288_08067 [Stachybotrys chartarum IBT 40288]